MNKLFKNVTFCYFAIHSKFSPFHRWINGGSISETKSSHLSWKGKLSCLNWNLNSEKLAIRFDTLTPNHFYRKSKSFKHDPNQNKVHNMLFSPNNTYFRHSNKSKITITVFLFSLSKIVTCNLYRFVPFHSNKKSTSKIFFCSNCAGIGAEHHTITDIT